MLQSELMIYIILSLFLYTIANLLSAFTARSSGSPTMVAAIVASVSAVIPLAYAIPLVSKKDFSSHSAIILSILSGLCIGLFTITLIKSLSINKVGIVLPIVLGGTLFLSTLLSLFVFKERVSSLQSVGLFLMGCGLIVLIYTRATGK